MLDKFNDEIQVISAGVNQSRGPWVTLRLPSREDALEFMDSAGSRFGCAMVRINDDETLADDSKEKEFATRLVRQDISHRLCNLYIDNQTIEGIKRLLGCKSLSQFAAQVCQSMKYNEFMEKDFSDLQIPPYPDDFMRGKTKVTSRSEYEWDPEAAQRFYDHFQEYKGWANDQAK